MSGRHSLSWKSLLLERSRLARLTRSANLTGRRRGALLVRECDASVLRVEGAVVELAVEGDVGWLGTAVEMDCLTVEVVDVADVTETDLDLAFTCTFGPDWVDDFGMPVRIFALECC